MRIYQKEGDIDMATRTLTQSQLNNNMSGTNANAIYYATHGGSGNTPVVTGYNPSGNYTTSNGSTTTYHLASPVTTDSSLNTSSGGNDSGGGGSKSGSGSGSGSYSGSYDTSAYGYSSGGGNGGVDLSAIMAARENAIRSAYESSMNRLNDAMAYSRNTLRDNLNSTLGRLQAQYEYNQNVANDDANKSLREAYINYMMNKKNLAQGLSAMGMSGGATESSMAKLFNNYGSSRNNINTTLADNLTKLMLENSDNRAKAEELWRTQDADMERQLQNQKNALDLAMSNALVDLGSGSSMSGYANYLNAINSMNPSFSQGNYASNLSSLSNTLDNFTPTQNTLATDLVNTTANNNMGSVTDYAKWKAMADSLSNAGANTSNIIYQLRQNGAPLDAVYQILGA